VRQNVQWSDGNHRQVNVKINRLLTPEGNLLAFTPGLRLLGFFRLALTARTAAALDPWPHEELFARDAATPNKGGQQQQRKKRTGEGSAHVLL
jgi:hypothetical protein